MESWVESEVVECGPLIGVEDLEALASGLCIVQWRSQHVWRHSSSFYASVDLSSAQRDGSRLCRPRHPNLRVG